MPTRDWDHIRRADFARVRDGIIWSFIFAGWLFSAGFMLWAVITHHPHPRPPNTIIPSNQREQRA